MKRSIASLALLLIIASASGAMAQETEEAQESEVLPLRIEAVETRGYPEIQLIVSVPPQLIGEDIPADGFAILDGASLIAPTVERLSNDDLEVVLVLDTSGSMAGSALSEAKAAAKVFTSQIPNGVKIAVVGFGDQPRIISPFTTDITQTDAAIDNLVAGGETALYDAIIAAAELFDPSLEARRSVVTLSDGGDTVSIAPLGDAIIQLLDVGADFYAIGLDTSESDSEALSRLAIASDGRVVAADDPGALAAIFNEIASGLVNRYELTYTTESYGANEIVVAISSAGVLAQGSSRTTFPPPPPAPTEPEPVPLKLEPEPVPLPEASTHLDPGLLGNPVVLVAGSAAVFLASALLLGLAFTSGRKSPLKDNNWAPSSDEVTSALSGVVNRAILFADNALKKRDPNQGLASLLERAGSKLRPGEFIMLAASGATIAFAIAYLAFGWIPAIIAAALVLVGSRVPFEIRATKRQAAFADQLGDNLQLIASSVRAGYGLLHAIDAVADEALPPTSDEFNRLVAEINLGRDTGEALAATAERIRSEDFKWVVEAMDIHRQVGGNLSELLDRVAETIRDRAKLRRKVSALTAEGRISATILLILPFAIGGMITVLSPEFMEEFVTTSIGKGMLGGGLLLMTIGFFWMRRVIRIDY